MDYGYKIMLYKGLAPSRGLNLLGFGKFSFFFFSNRVGFDFSFEIIA